MSDKRQYMSDAVVALRLGDGAIEWSRQITAGDEFNLYCRGQADGCPGEDMDIGASAVLVALDDGRERLVVGQKSGWVYGLEPADNGRLIWQACAGAADGRVLWDFDTAREYATVNQVAARGGSIDGAGPVIAGGRLYLTSGYGRNGGMAGNVLLAFEIPTID